MIKYNEILDLKNADLNALKDNLSKDKSGSKYNESLDLKGLNFNQATTKTFDPSQSFFNPVGNTGIGKSQYDKGISLGQLNLKPLEKIRASKQPWTDQLANAVLGGAASGAIGALEGFSAIGDQLMNIGNDAEEWERGALSQVLYDTKKSINDLTPIYRKDRGDVFDWNDPGFYYEVLKGAVDSAVAFGLPGAGYGMAVGKLGKLAGKLVTPAGLPQIGKLDLAAKRLDVLTRAGGRAMGITNPSQKLGSVTAGFLSNYNEGTVMGMQTYDEEKERLMEDLTQSRVNEKLQAGDETPLTQQELQEIEKLSSEQAGIAANYVRNFNHFMMGSNYLSVRSLMNPVSSAARSMVKKPSFKNWVKDQMIGAPAESAEEIVQGVLQGEVSFRSRQDFYKDNGIDTGIEGFEEFREMEGMSMGERLIDFATKDETLLEGMMGLVSGPIQFAVTGAPGISARNKALNTQYAKQQGIIGQNEKFITEKLKQEENKNTLRESFEEFNKSVLNKGEFTQEDQVKFTELIDNTGFDNLVVENFFGGTTENLEKELNSVLQDENATDQEKQNAEKYLSRMKELEARYNNYQGYQDGSHMFATQLRAERLEDLSKTFGEAFTQNERELTDLINKRLNRNSTKRKRGRVSMEDLLFFKEETTTTNDEGKEVKTEQEVPIRSVQQAIDGLLDGKKMFSKDGRIFNQKAFTQSGAFNVAQANRQALRIIEDRSSLYNTTLDENKSLEYENEFAKYSDALSIQNTEDKVKALEDFKKEFYKKYPGEKAADGAQYLNLKARLNQNINQYKVALAQAKMEAEETDTKEADEQTKKAQQEKIEKKTGTTPTQETPTSTTPDTKPDETNDPSLNPNAEFTKTEDLNFDGEGKPSPNPLIQAAEKKAGVVKSATPENKPQTQTTQETKPQSNVIQFKDKGKEISVVKGEDGEYYFYNKNKPNNQGGKLGSQRLQNKAKLKSDPNVEKVTIKVGKKELTFAVDSDNIIYNIDNDKAQRQTHSKKDEIIAKAEAQRQAKRDALSKSKEETKPDSDKITSPAHVLSDEDKKTAIDNYEPKPSLSENDTEVIKKNIDKTIDAQKANLDKSTKGKSDPTVAKVMTTVATAEFQEKVLKNMRDKTGLEVDAEVTTQLSQGMDSKAESLAKKAIGLYNKAKQQGAASEEDLNFMYKYLPVGLNFGKGAMTWLYPMNWKFDSEQNNGGRSIPQHPGELTLRKKVILNSISGKGTKVKVKGQLPGAINFGQTEKPLSEISMFENPMNANIFLSIDGFLQPAQKESTYNPFSEVFMQYNIEGNPEPWLGIFVVEVKALNGKSFPLKVNTKSHNDESASILFDLYNAMVSSPKNKNLMQVSIKNENPALFERIKKAVPGIINTYGEAVDYMTVINDMVFEGTKTKGRASELFFEKGNVHFGGSSYKARDFAAQKDNFIKFIKDFKTFNVVASKLSDPAYRKHVFENYLSTNADIDDMFTADGTLNPEGDSFKRMQSGAMYIDVTSAKTVESTIPAQTTESSDKTLDISQLETFDADDVFNDKPDPFGFNDLSETESDTPKTRNVKEPKTSTGENMLVTLYENQVVSDLLNEEESGISGMTEVEIQILKDQQQALLPEPDPDSMTLEEYNTIEKEVKNSKEWNNLQKKIDSLSNKPKTSTPETSKSKIDKRVEAKKEAEKKASEIDRCKIGKKPKKRFGSDDDITL